VNDLLAKMDNSVRNHIRFTLWVGLERDVGWKFNRHRWWKEQNCQSQVGETTELFAPHFLSDYPSLDTLLKLTYASITVESKS
jgi:hypothetical protein